MWTSSGVMVVVVPTLVSALYFGLMASDQYVSQSRFVIRAPGVRAGQGTVLANLVQTPGVASGREQTDEVLDYISSRDAAVCDEAVAELSKFGTCVALPANAATKEGRQQLVDKGHLGCMGAAAGGGRAGGGRRE